MSDAQDTEIRLRSELDAIASRFTAAEFGHAMGIVIGRAARREDPGFASSNGFRDPGPIRSDEQQRLNALVNEMDALRQQFPVSVDRLRAIGINAVKSAVRAREYRGPTERNLEFHLTDTADRFTAEEFESALSIAIRSAIQRNTPAFSSSNESRNPAPSRSPRSREGGALVAELSNYIRKFPTSIDRLRSIGNAVIVRVTQLEGLSEISRTADLLIDRLATIENRAGGESRRHMSSQCEFCVSTLDRHIADLSSLQARETDEGHRTRLNEFAARFAQQRTQLNEFAARFAQQRTEMHEIIARSARLCTEIAALQEAERAQQGGIGTSMDNRHANEATSRGLDARPVDRSSGRSR